ncbi:hypothetical protein F5883DRAFT_721520 [Diaporthe sp. PMI_573]|nr:hypothetical protein F5883DRAFT_721520 [Diaporthaceae sp. PMI_573]
MAPLPTAYGLPRNGTSRLEIRLSRRRMARQSRKLLVIMKAKTNTLHVFAASSANNPTAWKPWEMPSKRVTRCWPLPIFTKQINVMIVSAHALIRSGVLGGFAALSVSGFILSRASIQLASALNMSDSAFGATFLSLATTLPEKFLAVMSNSKGRSGLMVADAVGSNMFLLTLCLGIAAWSIASHHWHQHDADEDEGFEFVDIARIEAWWLWMATISLAVIVNFGGKLFCKFAAVRHVVGILMLMGYGGFLAIEFTILREE